MVTALADETKTNTPTNATMSTPANTNEVAVINTTEGTMVIEFWPDVAPKTVENFKTLANKGFYDGTCFHRVIKGFMIQGGDPLTKDPGKEDMWGTGGPGYQIKAEFNDRSHVRGVISMARSNNPDSAGSQFFICHGNPTFLDHQYTDVRQTDQRRRRAGKNRHHAHASAGPPRQAHGHHQHQDRSARRGEVICWSAGMQRGCMDEFC